MTKKIETVEKEKYSERELDNLAQDVYGDEESKVLGMTMQSLYILKHMDIPAYNELLEGLQEYVEYYICPICKYEHDDELDAEACCIPERISELEEMKQEFILNESVFADDSPSWGEVFDAELEAESRWDETEDGKELKSLRDQD